MSNWITYFLTANICLAIFYLFYRVFLVRETFFRFNRAYLLSAILLSFLIPALDTRMESAFLNQFSMLGNWSLDEKQHIGQLLIVDIEQEPNLQKEEIDVLLNSQKKPMLVSALPKDAEIHTITFDEKPEQEASFYDLVLNCNNYWPYFLGLISFVFLIRLLVSVLQMTILAFKYRSKSKKKYRAVFVDSALPTFSFFSLLFWQSNQQLTNSEKRQVFLHEMVHIRQYHSFDVLLCEVLIVLTWFNPFSYLYRRALKDIHEFEADRSVLKTEKASDYARLLLAQVFGTSRLTLANHFAQSQLKKRILMMAKDNSHTLNSWKYLLVIPLIVFLGLQFGHYEQSVVLNAGESIKGFKAKVLKTQGWISAIDMSEADMYVSEPEKAETKLALAMEKTMSVCSKNDTDAKRDKFMADASRSDSDKASEVAKREAERALAASEYMNCEKEKRLQELQKKESERAKLRHLAFLNAEASVPAPPSPVLNVYNNFTVAEPIIICKSTTKEEIGSKAKVHIKVNTKDVKKQAESNLLVFKDLISSPHFRIKTKRKMKTIMRINDLVIDMDELNAESMKALEEHLLELQNIQKGIEIQVEHLNSDIQ